MLPKTSERVPRHTRPGYNEAIHRKTLQNIRHYGEADDRSISRRLEALGREWDIERVLEANASAIAFCGILLGFLHPLWLLLPLAVTAFLFQHALQGWCPPVNLFRRMGFRTSYEIDEERYALKALRGDFDHLQDSGNIHHDIENFLRAVEKQ